MPYPRAELEEMVERWLAINKECEKNLNWEPMAELYTDDATYGWNVGPNDEFMAVGKDEIRELALGSEMSGLGGWVYPYQHVLIDDVKGEIMGLWKQVAIAKRDDGSHYEVAGLGGSWFVYGGDFKWKWQRDFFDVGNATAVFMEMIKHDKLTEGMQKRLERAMAGERLPGHFGQGEAPVGLWER
ncbi:MAG: nuclear transport factor 2 family protein [Actinomycetes bacterium]